MRWRRALEIAVLALAAGGCSGGTSGASHPTVSTPSAAPPFASTPTPPVISPSPSLAQCIVGNWTKRRNSGYSVYGGVRAPYDQKESGATAARVTYTVDGRWTYVSPQPHEPPIVGVFRHVPGYRDGTNYNYLSGSTAGTWAVAGTTVTFKDPDVSGQHLRFAFHPADGGKTYSGAFAAKDVAKLFNYRANFTCTSTTLTERVVLGSEHAMGIFVRQ